MQNFGTVTTHLFILAAIYICNIEAFTDEELEKIIDTAVNGDNDKTEFARFQNLDDIRDLKSRFDTMDSLSTDEQDLFGELSSEGGEEPVNENNVLLSTEHDGDELVPMQHGLANSFDEVNNEDQTTLNTRIARSLSRFYTSKRDIESFTKRLHKKETRSEGEIKANDNIKETFFERLRKCIKREECVKKIMSRSKTFNDDSKPNEIRLQTRNLFCNRRGCGRKKRSPVNEVKDFLKKQMIKVNKRNFICNRFGCSTKNKRSLSDILYNAPNRLTDYNNIMASDSYRILRMLQALKDTNINQQDNNVQHESTLFDDQMSDGQNDMFTQREASPFLSRLLNENSEFRRIPFGTCVTGQKC